MNDLHMPREELPVLANVDTVVVGGSAAGITCALRFAAAGKRVMVIESRTYLGREWTAVLRPWLELDKETRPPKWLEPFLQQITGADVVNEKRVSFSLDAIKLYLEDLLADNGVKLLFASLPVDLVQMNGGQLGLVIANKSGRQIVQCQDLVDATETALLSAVLGDPQTHFASGDRAFYSRTLEFHGAAACDTALDVPERLGIAENRIQTETGDERVYVRFGMEFPAGNTPELNHQREREARHRSFRLAEYLIGSVPAFHEAKLTAASYELYGPFAQHGPDANEDGAFRMQPDQRDLQCRPHVWCIFRDVYGNGNTDWLLPLRAAQMAEALADGILDGSLSASGSAGEGSNEVPQSNRLENRTGDAAIRESSDALAVQVPVDREHLHIQTGRLDYDGQLAAACADEAEIPVVHQADVLVVGGGSSGASAAIHAAQEGMNILLLEMNPGLGGTGTFGGVDSYWFGRRSGYAERIAAAVHAAEKKLRYKGPKWNIEAKKYALLCEAEAAGADIYFQVIVYGAVMNANRVRGAVCATRWGPRAVLAECVIDASGDGDMAAYAGADFTYGSERDQTVMWYSLAQFKQNGRLQNNFTSMVDVTDIRDYTRAVLAGRRRGEQLSDHGIYIATRESRHVVGDVVMKLTDQLLHRAWEDTVNIHFSNHDVKGVSGADWINIGLIPPNLEVEIPYRMLLPKSVEGLLVVGKAVSATHDAFPAIRMQSDLENLGGVAAQAAALAVRNGVTPRRISLPDLRQRLVRDGILPASILTRKPLPKIYRDEELEMLAAGIEKDKPLHDYANMTMNEIHEGLIPFAEIASIGPRIVPFLEREMAAAEGLRRIHLAQALALYESQEAAGVLISAIEAELKDQEGLPVRTAKIMYVQLPPDHGAMPAAANYLYSLAETRDARSIRIWEDIVRRFHPREEEFKDTWQGLYYYVDAVAQGAERLGSPEAIGLLERLHDQPLLNGLQRTGADSVQPDYFLERRAMLELALGRALARCGSAKGYAILIAYLRDGRSLLRKHALKELRTLSGKSWDARPDVWLDWLVACDNKLQPLPYRERLDIEENSERLLRRIEA